MGKKKVDVVENLMNLSGILNMHERAEKAGVPCKLNGERRRFNMEQTDCGTAACLYGSAIHTPYFKKIGLEKITTVWFVQQCHYQASVFGITPTEAFELFQNAYVDLVRATIPEVREQVFKLLRKYGGEEAVERAKILKKRGDKLRMGIE